MPPSSTAVRRRPIPARRLVPNLLTTIALCSGLAALHFAMRLDFDRAMGALAVAGILDALDGRAARLLHAMTRFGATFDSLSDVICFGVGPAFILYQWGLKDADVFGLAAVVVFVLCAAVRLARFTANQRRARSSVLIRYFQGLPTPGAAAAALIPIMLHESKLLAIGWSAPSWTVVPYTFGIAALMVSTLPIYSFKSIRVRRQWRLPLMLAVGLVVVSATRDFWLTCALLAGLYLASIPVSLLTFRRLRRRVEAGAPPLARVGPRPAGGAATADAAPAP